MHTVHLLLAKNNLFFLFRVINTVKIEQNSVVFSCTVIPYLRGSSAQSGHLSKVFDDSLSPEVEVDW